MEKITKRVLMKLLSIADLSDRWHYTKAGIHLLIQRPDFPKPFATVNRGRIKIFTENDIEAYELDKPWLFDENQKRQRQRLFCLLKNVEENPKAKDALLKKCFGEKARVWREN
jgi:hypothetical protein